MHTFCFHCFSLLCLCRTTEEGQKTLDLLSSVFAFDQRNPTNQAFRFVRKQNKNIPQICSIKAETLMIF